MANYYNSFKEASDSNYQLLYDLYKPSKDYKLFQPLYRKSCYDGALVPLHFDGSMTLDLILVEVKRRQFDSKTLQSNFNGLLFLEKKKYQALHREAKKIKKIHRDKTISIWYLTKTSDGMVYIFDITDKKYKWQKEVMNSVTYTEDQEKVSKMITMLDIKDADISFKTDIEF